MLQTQQIAVGTTATLLAGTPGTDITGFSVVVQAPADATLYVGPASVATATGFPVAAGTTITGDLEAGEALYGVLASGTGTAFVLRSGI